MRLLRGGVCLLVDELLDVKWRVSVVEPVGGIQVSDVGVGERRTCSWRKDWKMDSTRRSRLVGRRPMLVFATSGLYQTWSLCLKKRIAASFRMRGKVRKPVQNQLDTKRMVSRSPMWAGSIAGSVEKSLAMIFVWPFDDLSVITLSIFGFVDVNGLIAASE